MVIVLRCLLLLNVFLTRVSGYAAATVSRQAVLHVKGLLRSQELLRTD